jgi:hypothetical protein
MMKARNEGLTQIYNRFHNPDERSPDVAKLRELHTTMDEAVLDIYGFAGFACKFQCDFFLDYEEESEEGVSPTQLKKRPWRYRWPDNFRDEVLARLLELNEQRHKEELLAGAKSISEESIVAKKTKKKPEAVTKHVHDPDQPSQKELF